MFQFKGSRKKLLELPCAHTIDAHIGLAWQQFLHHLSACAARHAGFWSCIALGIDAAHGLFNRLFALADRFEKGDSLGTDAQPITGIFHVASADYTAVFTAHGSPHVDVRVGAMGSAGGPASPHK